MTLTKTHTYADQDGDGILVLPAFPSFPIALRVTDEDDGETAAAYVDSSFAAPLALNILGHDRPNDDPLATRFAVEAEVAHIASSQHDRDCQLYRAAALLMAVDGYDRRSKRLATAEQRRERAAVSLSNDVAKLNALAITSKTFGSDEIGKLREALGRYDAALAN